MQLRFDSYSDVGNQRKTNQDRCCAYQSGQTWVLGICDGMGGHAGGDVAAEMAIKSLHEWVLPKHGVEHFLRDKAISTSAMILRRGRDEPELEFMGCTLTAAFITPSGGWFVHVGDSRLYRLRENGLNQLTTDHRFLQELIDSGDLTEAELKSHPLAHQLDQALGVPELEPETGAFDLQPGDVLMLCSDGVTDELTHESIREVLVQISGQKAPARQLVQAALDAGGSDNTTAVVGQVLE